MFKKMIFKIHRYLSYIVFIQVIFWILGGLVFSIIPFNNITKGGLVLNTPTISLPNNWKSNFPNELVSNITSIRPLNTASGSIIEVTQTLENKNKVITSFNANTGEIITTTTEEEIRYFAQKLHKNNAKINSISFIDKPQIRLGIVDELYGLTDVWQVSFDDNYNTRLYFSKITGEFLKLRNDYWVLYDFFWRLHILDIPDGESFNGMLLRIAAILAFFFTLSGVYLTLSAIKRDLKRFKSHHR